MSCGRLDGRSGRENSVYEIAYGAVTTGSGRYEGGARENCPGSAGRSCRHARDFHRTEIVHIIAHEPYLE